jgi:hypothetical protein
VKNYTIKAIIVGKGKSAKFLKKENYENELLVAINQAALFIDYPDFIFANDIEGLDGISEEKLLKTKNLAIPEYPHYKLKPNLNIKFDKISNKCKNNLLIYNICSCPKRNDNFPYIDHPVISTGDTAVAFLAKFLNIKNFELYGIASAEEYHQDILSSINEENKKFSKTWDKKRVADVLISINILQKKYNLNIEIN